MRILVIAFSFLLAGLGRPAFAQDPAPAGAPQRVRVHLLGEETVTGFLRGRSADEVVVYTNDGRYRHLALSDVRSLEVRSRTGSHMGRGALVGLLVWGSVVGAAALDTFDEKGVASWESGAVLLGATGIGALVGRGIPRYGWVAADPRRVGGPAFPRSQVQVTLRF